MPPEAPIEPVVGRTASSETRGGTILGADNKAAVAAMLEAARRIVAEGLPHAGVELVFTPKEEVGLLGAGAFDHARLEAELGYVYDQAAPIGEVVIGAPSRALDGRPLPRPAGALPGCVPRRGGPRSRPRHARSPISGSDGSTR